MKLARLILPLTALLLTAAMARGQLVNYEMVTVGDPGRKPDTTGYGWVPYEYRIGKYEVTIGQFAAFLNAVAKTDTYFLYNAAITSNLNTAGISRAGVAGSYAYSVIGPSGTTAFGADSPASRPIAWVSWYDAARFANWMSNGQPTGAQGPTTTEDGAYALNGTSSGTAFAVNATNPNTGAPPLYRIPTENEWYKAAYYSPLLNAGSGGYYTHATQSNTSPGNIIGSGANQANHKAGVYSVTQSASYLSSQNYLTNVGAFTNSVSYYGTFDQSGNVQEWNDLTGANSSSRGVRGGSWSFDVLSSSDRSTTSVLSRGSHDLGFRLAAPVPEPSTCALALAGIAYGCFSMWRRRKHS